MKASKKIFVKDKDGNILTTLKEVKDAEKKRCVVRENGDKRKQQKQKV